MSMGDRQSNHLSSFLDRVACFLFGSPLIHSNFLHNSVEDQRSPHGSFVAERTSKQSVSNVLLHLRSHEREQGTRMDRDGEKTLQMSRVRCPNSAGKFSLFCTRSGTRVFDMLPTQLFLSGIAQTFLYRMVPSLPQKDEPSLRYDSDKVRGVGSPRIF